MITLLGNNAGYEGNSNDVKPTDVPVNTIFRELDTNCKYYYTGEAWVEIPGGGGGGGGGTDSYNDLENKPQINSVTLSGNKSLSALGIQGELTFDSAPTEDSTNPVESGGVYAALALKQDTLTIDSTPTESSTNPVESGGVYTALGNKQDTLTFNGTYNASTNPAATVSTVTGEISTAVGNLTKSDVGLDNVTNNAQIKAISGAVTSGDIVTFGGDGATVQDSGKAIETALTDSDNKIPTSKSIIDNAAGAEKLTGYSADSAEANITASTTVTGAIEQLDYRTTLNKNNISSLNQYAGGKNKFDIDSAAIYVSDASYTKNSDGTINVTKSTNTVGQVNMHEAFLGDTGTYIISGCPSGGSSTTYEMLIAEGNTVLARDYGEGATVSLTKGTVYQFKVVVRENQTLSNKLFKPMISADGGDYQPHALSNAELTNNIVSINARYSDNANVQTDIDNLNKSGIYAVNNTTTFTEAVPYQYGTLFHMEMVWWRMQVMFFASTSYSKPIFRMSNTNTSGGAASVWNKWRYFDGTLVNP